MSEGDGGSANRSEVEALLERADTSLAAGRTLLANGFFDFAAGRAYYAAFYAATAALLARDETFKTHNGLMRAVNLHFVRPGLLATGLGRSFDWLSKLRMVGDYGQRRHVPEEEAERALATAEELVAALKGLV